MYVFSRHPLSDCLELTLFAADLFHKTIQGRICLFMTRYDCTLQTIIRKRRENQNYFSLEQICFIANKVLEGIRFLHQHQIIHRDIKVRTIGLSLDLGTQFLLTALHRRRMSTFP